MAKKQETKTASLKSVEEKLKALYQLQLIDSEVDRIRTVRGELPLEIEDLQDSIEAYSKKKEKVVQRSSYSSVHKEMTEGERDRVTSCAIE